VKLAFSTTIKPYYYPWLQQILQLASNIIQEASVETNSLLLKAEGVLNLLLTVEVIVVTTIFVVNYMTLLLTQLLTAGSVLIQTSKPCHHIHVLKQTLPLTDLSNTQLNKNDILTLARPIIWPTTWATWISKVMIFLAMNKFALEMVQVWKSLILELHLYLPLLLLLFLITFLSYHKVPKIFYLFKNLLKTIMFILSFIIYSFLLRITRGTSYIKALCLMVSIPSLHHFNTVFHLLLLVLGSLS